MPVTCWTKLSSSPGRLDGQRLASKPGCLGGRAFGDDEHSAVLGVGRSRGERPQGVAVTLPEHTACDIVEPLTPQPLLGQPRRSELYRRQRDAGVVELPDAIADNEELEHRFRRSWVVRSLPSESVRLAAVG